MLRAAEHVPQPPTNYQVALDPFSLETIMEQPSLSPELRTIRLSQIVYDEAIYPRKSHSPELVQQ